MPQAIECGVGGDIVRQWLAVCLVDLTEHVGCVSAWGCLIEQCGCRARLSPQGF